MQWYVLEEETLTGTLVAVDTTRTPEESPGAWLDPGARCARVVRAVAAGLGACLS